MKNDGLKPHQALRGSMAGTAEILGDIVNSKLEPWEEIYDWSLVDELFGLESSVTAEQEADRAAVGSGEGPAS